MLVVAPTTAGVSIGFPVVLDHFIFFLMHDKMSLQSLSSCETFCLLARLSVNVWSLCILAGACTLGFLSMLVAVCSKNSWLPMDLKARRSEDCSNVADLLEKELIKPRLMIVIGSSDFAFASSIWASTFCSCLGHVTLVMGWVLVCDERPQETTVVVNSQVFLTCGANSGQL